MEDSVCNTSTRVYLNGFVSELKTSKHYKTTLFVYEITTSALSIKSVVPNSTRGIGHFSNFFTTTDYCLISPSCCLLFPNMQTYSK